MRRFLGFFLASGGAVATLWGAYHMLTGTSGATVTLYGDLTVNALTGGLIGVTAFTLGLIWIRD